jgi:hypothetical protein
MSQEHPERLTLYTPGVELLAGAHTSSATAAAREQDWSRAEAAAQEGATLLRFTRALPTQHAAAGLAVARQLRCSVMMAGREEGADLQQVRGWNRTGDHTTVVLD